MQVEAQRIVTISYELRDGNAEGPLLERMDANYPFKFYFGAGKLLPAFEKNLEGLSEGQSFSFILLPGDAYGMVKPDNIVNIPKQNIENLGENYLTKGNYISLTDDNGQQFNGRILSWNDESVRVDFNHAMAGKTLHFSGVILNVREATVDEHIRKSYLEEDGLRK